MVLREISFDQVTAYVPTFGNGRAMTSFISHPIFNSSLRFPPIWCWTRFLSPGLCLYTCKEFGIHDTILPYVAFLNIVFTVVITVTKEDTPPTTPASYRVPPRARHLPTAFVRSGPQEGRVPKRGSYHSTTATSVRGSHGQTTRRAPPEAADGRKTRRGGRSRQGTPGAELDGLSQGRFPSVRSHRRLYGGQPAHIRS